MSSTQTQQVVDEDLVDLQPDRQSLLKRMIAPKVIILTFLSLIFISKNIYNIYVIGPPTSSAPEPKPKQEEIKQQSSLMNRMYMYCIISVVLFIVYMMLVRINDRNLLKKIKQQEQKQKQKELQEQRKRQQQDKADEEQIKQRNITRNQKRQQQEKETQTKIQENKKQE